MFEDDRKKVTAIHEAGHAVLCQVLGWRVMAVTLDPTFEGLGECTFRPKSLNRNPADHILQSRNEIAVALAGFAAEKIILGFDREFISHTSDHHDACRNARELVGLLSSDEAEETEYRIGRELAESLVIEHRAAIERLAEILVEFDDAIQAVPVK